MNKSFRHVFGPVPSRRPCTLQDIAHGLGIKPTVLVKLLDALQKRGRLQIELHGAQAFYQAISSK